MSPGYILVVDDDADIRDMIRQVLELEGYEVQTARNGSDAIGHLRAQPGNPCLILLDLMMPGMSGWELRAELARDPKLNSVPLVVLSGRGGTELQRGLEGAEILRKPIDLPRLLGTVARYC